MYRGCTVAVVVPAYNEAGFVGEVIDTLPAFVDRAYVVDDASTDGTWAEICEHAIAANRAARGEWPTTDDGEAATGEDATATGGGEGATSAGEVTGGGEAATDAEPADGGEPATGAGATATGEATTGAGATTTAGATANGGGVATDPDERRVVPIRHGDNRGVGGAIATGYRRALADGMDVTAVMNGDGQMDPAILDRIVDPVVTGRAGYAKGDRLTDPERRASMSGWRLFGNALLTGLTRVATGYWRMTDSQNGYTAISRAALEAVDLDTCYDGYGFCNDLLAALGRAGVRVADVPMTAVYGDERSGIRYSRFVPGLSALLLVAFLRRLWTSHVVRELHPLVALYGLGAAGVAAGAAGVACAGVVGLLGAVGGVGGGGVFGGGAATGLAAVATALVGGLTGFLGAGLLALGATFDRAAAGDRVVRAAADGANAGDGETGGQVGEAGGPAGDGERAADGRRPGDGGRSGERTSDSSGGQSGDGPTDDLVHGPEVRPDGAGTEGDAADPDPSGDEGGGRPTTDPDVGGGRPTKPRDVEATDR